MWLDLTALAEAAVSYVNNNNIVKPFLNWYIDVKHLFQLLMSKMGKSTFQKIGDKWNQPQNRVVTRKGDRLV